MSSRQTNRIIAAIGVVLEVEGKRYPCMTGNLSTGGMYVTLREKFPVGTLADVTIPDEGKKLHARVRVASVDAGGLGLSWHSLDADFEQAWRRLIKKLLRRETMEIEKNALSTEVRIAWSYLPDGNFWTFWRKRQRRQRIANLSIDGVAFTNRNPPAVGESVLIYLTQIDPEGRKQFPCQAQVIRHTDDGFAVRFESPSVDFRRALSIVRRELGVG
jgi:hypothetical protein